jgi:hypothetical protein
VKYISLIAGLLLFTLGIVLFGIGEIRTPVPSPGGGTGVQVRSFSTIGFGLTLIGFLLSLRYVLKQRDRRHDTIEVKRPRCGYSLRRVQKALVLPVVVLAVFLGCVLAYSYGTRRQLRSDAIAAHHTAVQHHLALGRELNRAIRLAHVNLVSEAKFIELFGRISLLDRKRWPSAQEGDTHVYLHEKSYRVYFLRFNNGILMGAHSRFGVDDIQPNLPTIEARMLSMAR